MNFQVTESAVKAGAGGDPLAPRTAPWYTTNGLRYWRTELDAETRLLAMWQKRKAGPDAAAIFEGYCAVNARRRGTERTIIQDGGLLCLVPA